jgi:hypothetical protein
MADSGRSTDRLATSLSKQEIDLSFTGAKGVLYKVGKDALSTEVLKSTDATEIRHIATPVLIVHGTQYDPGKTGLPNPHLTFAHVVRTNMSDDLAGVSFGWFSAPFNLRNQLKSFLHGRATIYGLANKGLASQIDPLRELIALLPPEWTAVCHSIGCELLRRTLASHPNVTKPTRVLLLSGDLDEGAFQRFSEVNGIQVLAVRAVADRSLWFSRFRRRTAPFWKGQRPRSGQWMDLYFYPDLIEKGGRWSFSYRHRRRFWDHMSTFEFQEPWVLYNQFLRNGLPSQVPDTGILRSPEDGLPQR